MRQEVRERRGRGAGGEVVELIVLERVSKVRDAPDDQPGDVGAVAGGDQARGLHLSHLHLAVLLLPDGEQPGRVLEELLATGQRRGARGDGRRHMLLELSLLASGRGRVLCRGCGGTASRAVSGFGTVGDDVLVHRVVELVDPRTRLGVRGAASFRGNDRTGLVGHDALGEDDFANLHLAPDSGGDANEQEEPGAVRRDDLGGRRGGIVVASGADARDDELIVPRARCERSALRKYTVPCAVFSRAAFGDVQGIEHGQACWMTVRMAMSAGVVEPRACDCGATSTLPWEGAR